VPVRAEDAPAIVPKKSKVEFQQGRQKLMERSSGQFAGRSGDAAVKPARRSTTAMAASGPIRLEGNHSSPGKEAIVVPNTAALARCHVVFVRDGIGTRKVVQVFHTVWFDRQRDDKFTEIIAGVLPGEQVATKGAILRAELLKGKLGEGCCAPLTAPKRIHTDRIIDSRCDTALPCWQRSPAVWRYSLTALDIDASDTAASFKSTPMPTLGRRSRRQVLIQWADLAGLGIWSRSAGVEVWLQVVVTFREGRTCAARQVVNESRGCRTPPGIEAPTDLSTGLGEVFQYTVSGYDTDPAACAPFRIGPSDRSTERERRHRNRQLGRSRKRIRCESARSADRTICASSKPRRSPATIATRRRYVERQHHHRSGLGLDAQTASRSRTSSFRGKPAPDPSEECRHTEIGTRCGAASLPPTDGAKSSGLLTC
jgi:hypothetical protein